MTTPNLALASMDTNMLQPSVAFNAAMRDLDALVFLAIVTTTNTPPTTADPTDLGKRWIVGTSPTGVWAGQGNKIALCVGANLWYFLTPKEGWTARDVTTDLRWEYSGSAWAAQNFAGGAEFAGMITGLVMSWNSGTSLTVSSGAAHIEGTGRVLAAPSTITKAGLSLSNNTTYHVYLYSNAGTPDVEVVTTAPAAAYSGTARSKTGDTSRRYVGSVRSDGSGNMHNFLMSGLVVLYRNKQDSASFRLLNGGTATTETTMSVATVVPPTARIASLRLINLASSGNLYTGTSDDSAAGPPVSGIVGLSQGQAFVQHPLNSSQAITYWYDTTPSGGSAVIDVYGYTFER